VIYNNNNIRGWHVVLSADGKEGLFTSYKRVSEEAMQVPQPLMNGGENGEKTRKGGIHESVKISSTEGVIELGDGNHGRYWPGNGEK